MPLKFPLVPCPFIRFNQLCMSAVPLDSTTTVGVRVPTTPNPGTLSVIRVRPKAEATVTPESRASLIAEIRERLLQEGGTVLESRSHILSVFFPGTTEQREDLFRAARACLGLLEHIQKNSLYQIALGIHLEPTQTLSRSKARADAISVAATLAAAAREGEIFVSEETVRTLTEHLPKGWESVDVQDPTTATERIPDSIPLPQRLLGHRLQMGPADRDKNSPPVFIFEYLCIYPVLSRPEPITLLRLERQLPKPTLTTSSVSEPRIGRFFLQKMIGAGGMAKVWKAHDQFGNNVALKILLPSGPTAAPMIQRFQREAEILSKLTHRNICHIHEVGEFNGIHFLAMELVDGITLYDLLHTEVDIPAACEFSLPEWIRLIRDQKANSGSGKLKKTGSIRLLPVAEVVNLIKPICAAVHFAHEHAILHRDLKPANIMLREDGDPVVLDFGLGKLDMDAPEDESLTMSGMMLGTLEHMAPEQAISSRDVTPRSDVYSLGSVLYQMITGQKHFTPTGSLVKDANLLQTHEPITPRSLRPEVDTDLDAIILKCLRNNPEDRYRSVARLKDDLERWEKGEVILAKPITIREVVWKAIKRHSLISSIIAVSLLSFTMMGLFFIWNQNQINQKLNEALITAKANEQKAIEMAALADLNAKKHKEALDDYQKEKEGRETAQSQLQQLTTKDDIRQLQESARRGQRDEIIQLATKILKSNPKQVEALEILIGVRFLQFDFPAVLALSENLKDLHPSVQANWKYKETNAIVNLSEKYAPNLKAGNRLSPLDLMQLISDARGLHCYIPLLNSQKELIPTMKIQIIEALTRDNANAKADLDKNLKIELAENGFRLEIQSIPALKSIFALTSFPYFTQVTLQSTSVDNISALTQHPLTQLRIISSPVTELPPLKSKVLTDITLIDTRIKSLEPLRNRKIKQLYTTNITPPFELLKSLTDSLTDLGITYCTIDRFEPFKAFPLTSLKLDYTPLSNLDEIRQLNLEQLSICGTAVTNLEPVQNLNLKKFQAANTRISDLAPLKGMPLTILDVSNTNVNQIDTLQEIPLEELDLSGDRIFDISPLKNCKTLQKLTLTPTWVMKGLSELTQLTKLTELRLVPDPTTPNQPIRTFNNIENIRKYFQDAQR